MSSWADNAIAELLAGRKAVIRPRGNSMTPLVRSGEEVRLEPISPQDPIAVGDIVLVKVRGRVYLHLVRGVDEARFQIANNRGHVNGWVGRRAIYGRKVG